jgi:hypothetical protein
MGNYHVPFWRAVEGVTPSLTLIPIGSNESTAATSPTRRSTGMSQTQ